MRVVVIGATGHIGTYLVPQLVEKGHSAVTLSRGLRSPYRDDPSFNEVEHITIDRQAVEADGEFGSLISRLRADAVIDLICYEPSSALQLIDALRGSETVLLHCGTTWVHGYAVTVPVTEDSPRHPLEPYGQKKAVIESMLLSRHSDLRAVVLHPGHITGPGWRPVNPIGNLSLAVFSALALGAPVSIPNLGLETLHHVHAEDVATAFTLALSHLDVALGHAFHVASPNALTLRGYAESVARWFNSSSDLRFRPFEDWKSYETVEDAAVTWEHVSHSPSISIEKAQRVLGYQPRFTSLEAAYEAVEWLIAAGHLAISKVPVFSAAAHSERVAALKTDLERDG